MVMVKMMMMIVKFCNHWSICGNFAHPRVVGTFFFFCTYLFIFCTGCYVFLYFSLLAADILSVFGVGRKKVVQHWPCCIWKA